MKKGIIWAVLLLMVVPWLYACSSGDGGGVIGDTGSGGGTHTGGVSNPTSAASIVGTWQTSDFPSIDTVEMLFRADGSYTSVANEVVISLSTGTYSFSNNTLVLHYTSSNNASLQGTTETHANVTVTSSQLKFANAGATFNKINTSTGIIATWQTNTFPGPDTVEFVFKENSTFTCVDNEMVISLSTGTYSYSNDTLQLNFTSSNNASLQGTAETHNNVTLLSTQLNFTDINTIFTKQ